jgi:ATP:corrinoid adenosyltransferase
MANKPRANRVPPTDARYNEPQGERSGLVLVHTGDGKGKSTAAFGLALRAHGRRRGMPGSIFQFMQVPSARFGEHRISNNSAFPSKGWATASVGRVATWSLRLNRRTTAGCAPGGPCVREVPKNVGSDVLAICA